METTEQMLGCFNAKYDFSVKSQMDVDVLPIEDIAEELWVYSTSIELLTKPEDAEYLSTELEETRANIAEMFHLLVDKLPPEDIDRLTYICKKVFEGNKFDDALFNEFIESFMQKNMK